MIVNTSPPYDIGVIVEAIRRFFALHGIAGPIGPNVHRASIPYPSGSNDAFTPYTTPSSRSQLGGGLPVWITDIDKLPDGKIGFRIGYEYE